MPDAETKKRVAKDKREGKSASTQAGEFVREEIHHVREGKHGARSAKQAIAIGLSKARRAGVKLPPPKAPGPTRRQALRDIEASGHATAPARSRAALHALEHEGHKAASKAALSKHAKQAASHRSAADRSRTAKRAATTRARSAHS